MTRSQIIEELLRRWTAENQELAGDPQALAAQQEYLDGLSNEALQAALRPPGSEWQPGSPSPAPTGDADRGIGLGGQAAAPRSQGPIPAVRLGPRPGYNPAGAPRIGEGISDAFSGMGSRLSAGLAGPSRTAPPAAPAAPPRNPWSPTAPGQYTLGEAVGSLPGAAGVGEFIDRTGQSNSYANVRAAQAAGQGAAPGARVFPVQGYQLPQGRSEIAKHWDSHPGGADLFAPKGTPVVAMQGGTIQSLGSSGPGGNNLTIQGDDGLQYYYAHLNDFGPGLQKGGRVETGAHLGGVGDTGNAAGKGDHLHMGIGTRIASGTGPEGGTGLDAAGNPFDATTLFNQTFAGGGGGAGAEAAAAGPSNIIRTGRAFDPIRQKPQSFDEAAGYIADVVRNAGYSEDVAKIAIAIAAQEGGWNGAPGDSGKSVGAFHFHEQGKLHGFAQSIGLSDAQAKQLLIQAPMAGVDYAIRSYIGPLAEQGGMERAIHGFLDATTGQYTGGQNPNSVTTAYDAQLNRLFGQGQLVPSLAGTATRADVPFGMAGMAGITYPPPKMPAGGFTDETAAFDYQQLVMEWARDQQAAIPSDDPNYKEKLANITALTGAMWSGAQEWHKLAYTKGVDTANRALEQQKMGIQQQQFGQTFGLQQQQFGLQKDQFAFQMQQAGFENELALMKFGREGDIARGWIDGQPTLGREQFETERGLSVAGLTGVLPEELGGGQTLAARTLEEEIERNRNDLRKGFAEFGQQGDIALMGARQNALKLAQQQAENAAPLDPTGQYLAGWEPGGMVSNLRGTLGMPFSPMGVGQLPRGPDPREGLAQLEEAFARRAAQYPQPRF